AAFDERFGDPNRHLCVIGIPNLILRILDQFASSQKAGPYCICRLCLKSAAERVTDCEPQQAAEEAIAKLILGMRHRQTLLAGVVIGSQHHRNVVRPNLACCRSPLGSTERDGATCRFKMISNVGRVEPSAKTMPQGAYMIWSGWFSSQTHRHE